MVGKTISHYRILEEIGRGGMGVVYKADDTKLHRSVALKFLSENTFTTEREKTRFAREAQSAAKLNHPNIATIYDYDEVEDQKTATKRAFIAMEFVEGKSLKEKIAQGPLSIEEVISIIVQMAKAMHSAHMRGIIHRDIKPANIILKSDGTVKILDFGLAKLSGETRSTESGKIVGSIAYMSPEQVTGEKVDERSDIWSLGVVTFEMLTGHLPFRGEHPPAMMYSITNEQPLEISNFRSGVPAALVTLVKRCLQKD